jgi:streptogrisin C
VERRSAIAVVTAAVLAGGGLTVAAPAAADVSLDLPRRAAPVALENRGSIAYLTAQYKISEDEALRRLALQRMAPALDSELAKKFPKTFAGSYLDQD